MPVQARILMCTVLVQVAVAVLLILTTSRPNLVTIQVPPKHLAKQEIENRWHFWVHGRVTDTEGRPLANAEVYVNTGIATLRRGGSGKTDADGRYKVHFGPGVRFTNYHDSPLSVGIQAAIVRVRFPRMVEQRLCHSGSLGMTDIVLKDKQHAQRRQKLVRPGRPQKVDFVMIPAARLKGRLIDQAGRAIANQYLTLNADETGPASSVLANVQTDGNGGFEFSEVRPGVCWFEFRNATRTEVRSDRLTLKEPRLYRFGVRATLEDGIPTRLDIAPSGEG